MRGKGEVAEDPFADAGENLGVTRAGTGLGDTLVDLEEIVFGGLRADLRGECR